MLKHKTAVETHSSLTFLRNFSVSLSVAPWIKHEHTHFQTDVPGVLVEVSVFTAYRWEISMILF